MSTPRLKWAVALSVVVAVAAACSQPDDASVETLPEAASTLESAAPPTDVSERDERAASPEVVEAAGLRRTPPPLVYTPTGPPPKLDTSRTSVDLADVLFDTFLGSYIPLATAQDATIERLRDAIQPIYEPVYDTASGGDWLDDADLVVGYESPAGAFAYPVKILNFHEIVHDVVDGVPILVTYCPLCASAVVYDRELDDGFLVFGNTSALYHFDMVMYDHQTGSYWFQVAGEAIVGALTGKQLTMLPSVTVTWAEWKRRHPDTQVLSRELGFEDLNPAMYARDAFGGYDPNQSGSIRSYLEDRGQLDERLRPGDRVIAVQVSDSHMAYPVSEAADWVVNDEVGSRAVIVVGRANGPTASAYFSTVDGQDLTFMLNGVGLEDVETGTIWSDGVVAVSGAMEGARLEPVPSRTTFWFSLTTALPAIPLYTN